MTSDPQSASRAETPPRGRSGWTRFIPSANRLFAAISFVGTKASAKFSNVGSNLT